MNNIYFIERIRDGIAYLTHTESEIAIEVPETIVTAACKERRRCRVVFHSPTAITVEPVPDLPVSEERRREIDEQVAAIGEDWD